MQYVEHVALSSGSKEVRIKAQEYRKGLFDLPEGPEVRGGHLPGGKVSAGP